MQTIIWLNDAAGDPTITRISDFLHNLGRGVMVNRTQGIVKVTRTPGDSTPTVIAADLKARVERFSGVLEIRDEEPETI